MTADLIVIVALCCLLISLGLAWLASLILYARLATLKRIFPASHQLIRAHIDFLLMSMLLVMFYYLGQAFGVEYPAWTIALLCIGAVYNPLGFIVLAIKPDMANPKTSGEKLRILLGFLPATLGFGGASLLVLQAVLAG